MDKITSRFLQLVLISLVHGDKTDQHNSTAIAQVKYSAKTTAQLRKKRAIVAGWFSPDVSH